MIKGLYTMGTCIAYMVLVGDFLTLLADDLFPIQMNDNTNNSAGSASSHHDIYHFFHALLSNRCSATIMITVLCMFPLSLLRSLNALRFTSGLSIVCIAYTVAAVAGTYIFKYHMKINETVKLVSISPKALTALPLLSVSFTGHYNAPRLYYELGDRSVSRFRIVVTIALSICAVCYSVMALSGYFCFGSSVDGDILNNLRVGSDVAIIARAALLFTIVFSYPLVFHSMRASVHQFMTRRKYDHEVENQNGKDDLSYKDEEEKKNLLSMANGEIKEKKSENDGNSEKEITFTEALLYSITFITMHVIIALLVPQVIEYRREDKFHSCFNLSQNTFSSL